MQSFNLIINPLRAFVLLLIISLVNPPVFAETAGKEETIQTQKNLNLSGLYLGFFPCDDCQGIRTTLALNNNGTYVYISLYVGKSDREFVEKGKFSLGENGDTLVLKPRKGSTTTQHYLIDDDMLIKLDEDGSRITKDGADRFILKRKDVIKTKDNNNHSGH
jgi:copper homeostasis protein (lipoprotein)